MVPSRKRSRGAAGGGSSAAQRGMWAQMKFSKAQPWADWGAMRVKRGTPENLAIFGPTYKEATEEQRSHRKQHGYTGRGKYYGKVIGSALGSKFGGPLGGVLGGVAGDLATNLLHKKLKGRGLYVGRGEYEKTVSNELMSRSTNSPPMFSSAGDEAGALTVSHREYVGDIFAPGGAGVSDFVVQSFPINPGLEQTFPWLSQIAQNYEEYELKQCVFEFVSTVQDINSSNGQVGTVITATQYNPSQPDFADKPAMAAYAHSVSGKSTDNQTHGVECDPNKLSGSEGKYVRANPVMFGEDLKTYDHGRFQLATHNIPSAMASGTLGELYVSYTVCLRKPKFFTGRGLGLTRYLQVVDATQGATLAATTPFGLDGEELVARQNNLSVKTEKSSNQVKLIFPAYYGGRLRVSFIVEGDSLAASGGSIIAADPTLTGNVTLISDMFASGQGPQDSPSNLMLCANTQRLIAVYSVNVEPSTNATDNSFTLITDITAGTLNQSSIEVQEYNTFGANEAPQLVNAAGTAVTLV
jgi:hypothetical protein